MRLLPPSFSTALKRVKASKKLLDVVKAKEIIWYTFMIRYYQQHGFRLIAFHQLVVCEQGNPLSWFPEEVANVRHEANMDPNKTSWMKLQN